MIVLDKDHPRGIIWIASYPRSGNTWTRAFINALVNIQRDPGFSGIDLNRIEEFSASESGAEQYGVMLGKPATRATDAEIAAIRPRVQEAIVRKFDRPIFVKTHNAHVLDRGVPVINTLVSAGAIYIVRNPLDVAISFARLRNVPIDRAISDMATSSFGRGTDDEFVRTLLGSWSDHVRSWTDRPNDAVLVVRYEDLGGKPQESFEAIARHLLMRPTAEQLDRAIAMANFDSLRQKEDAHGFREKPSTAEVFFREGRSGQWRDVLTPEQVKRMVTTHGVMMRKFGYLPEDAPTTH